jgi:fibrillarin-like rRNA methylase
MNKKFDKSIGFFSSKKKIDEIIRKRPQTANIKNKNKNNFKTQLLNRSVSKIEKPIYEILNIEKNENIKKNLKRPQSASSVRDKQKKIIVEDDNDLLYLGTKKEQMSRGISFLNF